MEDVISNFSIKQLLLKYKVKFDFAKLQKKKYKKNRQL